MLKMSLIILKSITAKKTGHGNNQMPALKLSFIFTRPPITLSKNLPSY